MLPKPKRDTELDALRRKYDRLCGQIAQGSGSDPAAEGAIIEELQRLSDRIVDLMQEAAMSGRPDRDEAPDEAPKAESGGGQAGADRTRKSVEKVLALLERQSVQVEHIVRRSDEHRDQLDRVERRLTETVPLIERQLPELRAATEHQRQRITALAVAVQRLSQWLMAQHGRRP